MDEFKISVQNFFAEVRDDARQLRILVGQPFVLDDGDAHQRLFHQILKLLPALVPFGGAFAYQLLQGVAMAFEFDVGADACLDDHRVKGLGDIVHGPELESLGLGGLVRCGRHKNHRNIMGPGVGFQLSADLEAVHPGHDQIQQNKVRHDPGGVFEALETVLVSDNLAVFML